MSEPDWTVLEIEGVERVVQQVAAKTHRKYANTIERADAEQEARIIILATKPDEAKAWRQRQRGPVKTCSTCKRRLPVSAFNKDGNRRDGLEPRCRECRSAMSKARYVPKPHQPRFVKYGVGSVFGSLTVIERFPRTRGSAPVVCQCTCGNVKRFSLQNLVNGRTVDCADRSQHIDPRNVGDAVGYEGAHQRVARERGKASEHPCWRCGRQAQHWAYLHGDVDEKRSTTRKDFGRTFSADPGHYVAMCRGCHQRFDVAHAKTSGGGLSLPHHVLWLALQPDATTT